MADMGAHKVRVQLLGHYTLASGAMYNKGERLALEPDLADDLVSSGRAVLDDVQTVTPPKPKQQAVPKPPQHRQVASPKTKEVEASSVSAE